MAPEVPIAEEAVRAWMRVVFRRMGFDPRLPLVTEDVSRLVSWSRDLPQPSAGPVQYVRLPVRSPDQ